MRYRVFLSSTYEELKAYRRAVIRTVRESGFDIDPMEEWPADPREPSEFSQHRILHCDVCILLAARRRGFVPPNKQDSITQQEYRCAVRQKIDPLVFVLDDAAEWPGHWDERQFDPLLKTWRDELRLAHGAPFFPADPGQLALKVAAALSRWKEECAPKLGLRKTRRPLPVPRTKFFGRVHELQALEQLFVDGGERLVTLLAPGGYGKTRIALELAHRLRSKFPGEAVFVDLTEAETEMEVAFAVADAFGYSLERTADPAAAIRQLLSEFDGLIVLDNFEQLTILAPSTVDAWGSASRNVRFLITSRSALHVEGETIFPLDPLPMPAANAHAPENDAVRLFADRARHVRRSFTLNDATIGPVVDICRRVECQPLLVEIAASRLKKAALDQIARDLGRADWLGSLSTADRAFGKREGATALKTLKWSYDLLSPQAQSAFLQVCVFRGGFALEAALAIVELAGDWDTASEELIDHCFLRFDPDTGRYSLYALSIHEFGRRLWNETWRDEEALEALFFRWAEYYAGLGEECNRQMQTAAVRLALEQLDRDRENLMECHQWALGNGHAALAVRLILAAVPLLIIRGPQVIARDRLNATLELAGPGEPQLHCPLLLKLSQVEFHLGDFGSAQTSAEKALQLIEKTGDQFLLADAYRCLAQVADNIDEVSRLLNIAIGHFDELAAQGKAEAARWGAACRAKIALALDRQGLYAKAMDCHQEAETVCRRLNNVAEQAIVLNLKGLTLWHGGSPAEAIECFKESEGTHRELGNTLFVAGTLTNRGLALTDLDRLDEAVNCFEDAVGLLRQVGNRAWLGVNRGGLGWALVRRGETEGGIELLREAEQLALAAHNFEDAAMHQGFLGRAFCRIGRYPEALDALGRAVQREVAIHAATTIRHLCNRAQLAYTCWKCGGFGAAREHIEAAEKLARLFGISETHPVATIAESMRFLNEAVMANDPVLSLQERLRKYGWPLSAEAVRRALDHHRELAAAVRWQYPWPGLEASLTERPLPLIAYGSLMNADSARLTLGDPARLQPLPVLVFGGRRVYHYTVPENVLARYPGPREERERAALNVEESAPGDVFNGVLLWLPPETIPAFREREKDYHLVPMAYLPWGQAEPVPGTAYVLVCTDRAGGRINDELLPLPGYHQLCLRGARSHAPGEPFGECFLDTSFLGDGRPVRQVYPQ